MNLGGRSIRSQKVRRREEERSWWKRRIEKDIKQMKKDIKILEKVKKGKLVHAKMVRLNWSRKSAE